MFSSISVVSSKTKRGGIFLTIQALNWSATRVSWSLSRSNRKSCELGFGHLPELQFESHHDQVARAANVLALGVFWLFKYTHFHWTNSGLILVYLILVTLIWWCRVITLHFVCVHLMYLCCVGQLFLQTIYLLSH